MVSSLAPSLSLNDSQVLEALLDPEASSDNSATYEHLNVAENTPSWDIDSSILKKEQLALQLLNSTDPTFADLQDALSKLNDVCTQAPKYAPGWCNRAQATRLYLSKSSAVEQGESEAQHFLRMTVKNPRQVQRIFDDLTTSVYLASRTISEQVTSLPLATQARVLAAAYTHRGYLLWLLSRVDEQYDANILPSPMDGLSKERLEEKASTDFALGGKYGNQIAKQLSVKTNPYVKLCGNIVQEAMRNEVQEYNNRMSGSL